MTGRRKTDSDGTRERTGSDGGRRKTERRDGRTETDGRTDGDGRMDGRTGDGGGPDLSLGQTLSRRLPDAGQTCQPDVPDAQTSRRCQTLPDAQGARTTGAHDVQASPGVQPDAQMCQTCQTCQNVIDVPPCTVSPLLQGVNTEATKHGIREYAGV
eukprot:6145723-Prymnesium_polylepis.1